MEKDFRYYFRCIPKSNAKYSWNEGKDRKSQQDNQIRSDHSLSRVPLFATLWIAARQASLSITNSRSSLRLTSIESVMPSSHLILCRPLLLLPPIPPSIRVLSNESALHIRWPKYWSFSFSIIPSKEIPGLISKWQPTPVFLLENPRDGGAWWAAVYGVTQSRTELKGLSSSSSSIYPNIFWSPCG